MKTCQIAMAKNKQLEIIRYIELCVYYSFVFVRMCLYLVVAAGSLRFYLSALVCLL